MTAPSLPHRFAVSAPSARIQQLSPRLANQIAAGEVVERPASVVKELLENSLDAGASRIDIEIERGGIQLIRLSDNGDGIHPDDLPLALARHATSKISTIDDLAAVLSLGFRGEALASIASVAKLLLTSRRRGESSAWQAFAEGAGMQVQVQPAALSEGTRIDVRDLFFNTPARRRFLRSEATEFAHIDDVVRRVALARPDVAITLKHNGRGVRQLRAGRDQDALTARVSAVLGRSFLITAQPVDVQLDTVRMHGFVGHPDQHRAQPDAQFVFVNGRAIRDRVVSHAIRAGYADRVPAGRSPCYALFLSLPASDVDVNVHPTKHEVRFRNARWLHDWLTRTVSEAIAGTQQQINTETGEVSAAAPASIANVVANTAAKAGASMFAGYSVREATSGYQNVAQSAPHRERSTAPAVMPFAPAPQPALAHNAAAEAEAEAIALRRVSTDLLLEWSQPLRLWPMTATLTAWLAATVFGSATPASLPLLLPVRLPFAPDEAFLQQLRRHGFVVRDEQLFAAPSALRGADWSSLLQALSTAENAQWPALAAAHLSARPCCDSPQFWQPVVTWAATEALALSRSPSAAEWDALWSR